MSDSKQTIINIDKIEKTYADEGGSFQALKGINFAIEAGEFVAIMGPSGSGKSTLLHILSFLDRPTGGVYTFNGKSISELDDVALAQIRNKEMGFVFQAFNLMNRATVYSNVELPLLYSPIDPAKRDEMVRMAIASVGLTEKADTEAGKLSGGQKQRVAIARALVNDPNVIFADEPTGNLDSKSGEQVMAIFRELHRSGRTIILVTHETTTAQFADRLIRVKDGVVESDQVIDHSLAELPYTK